MRDVIIFGSGFLAGALWLVSLAYFFGKREGRRVEADLTKKWSERSGLTREPGETFEAFTDRATTAAAERDLEQEWGVARHEGESWDVYMQRVAKQRHDAHPTFVGMPVVIGPRGQA
jgi:hypothetical protein